MSQDFASKGASVYADTRTAPGVPSRTPPKRVRPAPFMTDSTRYFAARVLSIAASSGGQLDAIAKEVAGGKRQEPVARLARQALAESLEAGNWRQQRGEAEARLRSGK